MHHSRPSRFASARRFISAALVTLLPLPSGALSGGVFQVAAQETATDSQTRASKEQAESDYWLRNMWIHRYSLKEMQQVLGLSEEQLKLKLETLALREEHRDNLPGDKIFVLPYPGGRHPRIGFLDGAVDPQRETKLSVFCPWDSSSYAVLDVPEAIWSNLGLTYLAHTHIDTIWSRQLIKLPQLEWEREIDGDFSMARTLPNGIKFGTRARPQGDHLQLLMWLTNGADEELTDLRVQNCVMLKAVKGFNAQTNDNKMFVDGYAIAHSADKTKWIISAWDPVQRAWGNAPCPCMHSDPQFPDCKPGATQYLRGWFSFYEGKDIQAELKRIEGTNWRSKPIRHVTGNVIGSIFDEVTGKPMACRVYAQNMKTKQWFHATSTAPDGHTLNYAKQAGENSVERHTTVSAHEIQWQLPPGSYRFDFERGPEYVPYATSRVVGERLSLPDIHLKRWSNMNQRGWYSGDTHVHRSLDEMKNLQLAEDLNVAFPLSYWVRDSQAKPSDSGEVIEPKPTHIDDTHVYYPVNTEYEIFTVDGKRHTQGAVFVLNHRTPLELTAPPVSAIAQAAREQGGLLDLDKHSWNWSMMIVPVMKVDLFELGNNHHWRTNFGFPQWTVENAPPWPEIERRGDGFTELGWTTFGFETYYTLLNCGQRMRITAGTGAGVHPVPLGRSRVYVHCGDQFTYENWVKNLNAGQSFVTQGPMLDLRFNNELPGHTWRHDNPKTTIRITGEVLSRHKHATLEIIRNGEIAKSMDLVGAKGVRSQMDESIDIEGSGWLAVRCFETVPAYALPEPQPPHQDYHPKVSFAHTNPVFVDVPGTPLRPRRQRVKFLIQRMDNEIKRNEGVLSEKAVDEFRAAKGFYRKLLRDAR